MVREKSQRDYRAFRKPFMTPTDDAHAAAAAEGLVLLRANNSTGFKNVKRLGGGEKPFKAQMRPV